jgi:predicted amidohydrolase
MGNRRNFLKTVIAGTAGGTRLAALGAREHEGADPMATEKARVIPVAVIQFDAVSGQVDRNLREMERLSTAAAQAGARWILFHELTTCDYVEKAESVVEPVPEGPSTKLMAKIAKRCNCFIAFGLAESHRGRVYDALVFVGPHGYVFHYRKTWLWHRAKDTSFRDEWLRYDPGSGPEIFSIDGVRATCFICSDGDSARCITELAALKPHVVFYPNNREGWPSLEVFGKMAKTIQAPMLVANRVGRSVIFDCPGGCAVFSAQGEVLAKANREGREEILYCKLELPLHVS